MFNKGSAGLPVMGNPSEETVMSCLKEKLTRQWKQLAAAWEGSMQDWTNASEFRLVVLWVPFIHHSGLCWRNTLPLPTYLTPCITAWVWSWTLLHCPSYPACPGSWYLQEAPVRGAYWEDQSDSSSGFSLVAETPAPWPLGPVPALPLTSDPALLSHTVSLSVWLSLTSFFFWESELQFISFVGFHKGAV